MQQKSRKKDAGDVVQRQSVSNRQVLMGSGGPMAPLLFPSRVGGIYKRKEYYVFLFSLFGDSNAGK